MIKYLGIILLMIFIIKFFLNIFLYIPPSYTFSNRKIYSIKKYIFNNTINNPLGLIGINNKENIIPLKYQTNNINKNDISNKRTYNIYIYNTHQTEKYSDNKSVLDASKYMKSVFSKYNISSDVELSSIPDFMRINNISYAYSYDASRYYIKNILNKKYDLIIDLHRDSIDKESVTLKGKKKRFAKILFVIGGENKNYKYNYKIVNTINNKIKKKYPNLTRGIIIKRGKGVNGVYNQDLSHNIILIEIGSDKSSFDEVKNTIDLIVPIIGEYLNETN